MKYSMFVRKSLLDGVVGTEAPHVGDKFVVSGVTSCSNDDTGATGWTVNLVPLRETEKKPMLQRVAELWGSICERPAISFTTKRGFWFNIGWYPGEPFKLFELVVGEVDMFEGNVNLVAVFLIQVAKFVVGFGVGA